MDSNYLRKMLLLHNCAENKILQQNSFFFFFNFDMFRQFYFDHLSIVSVFLFSHLFLLFFSHFVYFIEKTINVYQKKCFTTKN